MPTTDDTVTENAASRYPRFYVFKDHDDVWTWGYRRPGETAPAGVRLYVHTMQEAIEIAAARSREDARRASDHTDPQLDLLGLA